ncbi:isocitrate lyase/phosphoenolpyruvate mutase family protein [Streptomyces sp. JH14]|uniref:isocitrate lyase/phosphoenolpyruvate mutase family protein n=1 Tax=Streptomyces sp. JH14 TaxID=2793630 RepID=UPI0023F71799|nr:isocitrate lyase/phosphoenolpyruvate mutase family protein [Streptomyces sp. JH14]MDF6043839.1 isocitrate lyase/phosphoenolpyruvate mutase family protein [Streptomyces sp. JH14]
MSSAVIPAREERGAVPGARQLRELFARDGAVRIVGAHNPLGARLAERAGFDGVWSSGLEVSASQGVPDTDILTMSELLGVASSLASAVAIPVVADCDAGYGNAHNVMNMVQRYEAAGIAAVSIEDKRFPKVNSFIPGRQELAPVPEFCGKLAAAKAAQRTDDFMVIARIEALIAGWGLAEALRRGEAYAEAGADAVLIHSKDGNPEEVLRFLSSWRLRTPVVVVPTTYHTVTATELAEAGAKMVIYANHGLRAGITAVSETFASILREDRTTAVEGRIAPLTTVFDLQGMPQQKRHEAQFITPHEGRPRALVVPGGAPAGPGPQLLEKQTSALRRAGIESIVLATAGATPADCPQDVTPGATHTDAAGAVLELPGSSAGRTVLVSADTFVEAEPLRRLAAVEADIAVLVDVTAGTGERPDALGLRLTSVARDGRRICASESVEVIGRAGDRPDGEFVGAAAFSPAGMAVLRRAAEKRQANSVHACLADLLNDLLADGHQPHAVEIASGWLELRTEDDIRRATQMLATRETAL